MKARFLNKFIYISIISFCLIIASPTKLYAPWIWTPENGWMNEKDMVRESPKAQWECALKLEKEKKYGNAARAYKALIKAYPTSPQAPLAQIKTAECYEHDGFYYEAFQQYQKLLENYPKQIDFEDILKRQYKIGELYIQGKKRKLLNLPIVPAVDKGIEILQTIVKNAPYAKISPQAQFDIGTAYKRQGKYTEAVEAYNKVVTNYKDSRLYKEALYQVGWCNYQKSRGFNYDQMAAKDAAKTFDKYLQEFPEDKHNEKVVNLSDELTSRQAKGVLEISRFYENHGYKEAAIMYYKDVVEKFPGTVEAQQAEKRIKALEK